ncbi:MAG: phosphodiester glycosidase family protein [Treponema sp.]|jgi:hypothetical protein|nr:phosphodiester glycosidase family protein [Treponema sp.]
MKFFPGRTAVLVLTVLVPLASCATLSPVNTAPEGGIPKAPAPESVRPRWQPFADHLVRGLDYFAGKTARPRLEFRALRVDLHEPALRIVVYAASAPDNAGGTVPGIRVSSFVRRYGLLAGINAAPFDLVSGREGEPLTVAGLIIAEGMLRFPPNPRYGALVFYAGGGAAIRGQGELGGMETIENAVGGFHLLLADGRLSERALRLAAGSSNPRYPRSAAGLSADGRYLYLLAIDGRRPGSAGATEAETAIILRQLGAAGGLNLDGGGSTAMALRFPDGKVRPVNIPIHGGIPGRERAVASCLGIGLAPEADGGAGK